MVLLTFTFWGQSKIVNSLTTDYKNIKGTKISLIPPKGFEDAKNFLGIQRQSEQYYDSGDSWTIFGNF